MFLNCPLRISVWEYGQRFFVKPALPHPRIHYDAITLLLIMILSCKYYYHDKTFDPPYSKSTILMDNNLLQHLEYHHKNHLSWPFFSGLSLHFFSYIAAPRILRISWNSRSKFSRTFNYERSSMLFYIVPNFLIIISLCMKVVFLCFSCVPSMWSPMVSSRYQA